MLSPYRFEVCPKIIWKNALTNATASIFGAKPAGEGWSMVQDGFTFHDNLHNTSGCYGTRNLRTKEEIEAFLLKQFGVFWPIERVNRAA